MMRVYICPDCGWMRMVSRRKNVECYKCGVQDMTLAKVDFATYVSWSEKEREEYAAAWMYIHSKGKTKRNQDEFMQDVTIVIPNYNGKPFPDSEPLT